MNVCKSGNEFLIGFSGAEFKRGLECEKRSYKVSSANATALSRQIC